VAKVKNKGVTQRFGSQIKGRIVCQVIVQLLVKGIGPLEIVQYFCPFFFGSSSIQDGGSSVFQVHGLLLIGKQPRDNYFQGCDTQQEIYVIKGLVSTARWKVADYLIFRVAAFNLYKNQLTSNGAEHTIIETYPLKIVYAKVPPVTAGPPPLGPGQ